MKPKICNKCQGSGHDTAGRPVIKMVTVKVAQATTKRKHVTKKRGSGCPQCLGYGIMNPEVRAA